MKPFLEEMANTWCRCAEDLAGPPFVAEIVAIALAVALCSRMPASLQRSTRYVVLSVVLAMLTVTIGIAAGLFVGFSIAFGPSYLTGDFTGLPWLTVPAGFIVGCPVSAATGGLLYLGFVRLLRRSVGAR